MNEHKLCKICLDFFPFACGTSRWGGMMELARCRNSVSTRHTTASRCQAGVRPHLSAAENTSKVNAPLCLNLSCWLYGNDPSQDKHNKPLASPACWQRGWGKMAISALWVCVCVSVRELDRHWECILVHKYVAPCSNKSRLNDVSMLTFSTVVF